MATVKHHEEEEQIIPSMDETEDDEQEEAPASSTRKQAAPARYTKALQGTKTLVDQKKKKHRFRPGTVALREIRNMQRSTDLLIPRQPMRRLVREIAGEQRSNIRMTKDAAESLHVAAEAFITDLFASGMYMAVFAGRTTLELKDLRMAVEQSGITLSKEYLERVQRIRKIN